MTLHHAALLIIDVQKAIDHPSWGKRNNPQAEQNIGRLLAAWRQAEKPIIHVRHISREQVCGDCSIWQSPLLLQVWI